MTQNFEILDSITESMAIIDKKGEILFTNKALQAFSDDTMGEVSCTGLKNNYLLICSTV